MKLYYVDKNCALDFDKIISYNYEESELGKTIVIGMSNGLTIEVNDYFERSKPLFNALMEWHKMLGKEIGEDGFAHVA